MAPVPTSRTGAQAVERALAVLRVLERADGTVALSRIAEQTGLSPSTTHRIVGALCDGGMVQQDPRTERYGLGPHLVILGERAARGLGVAAARPALERLSADTGESVNLGALDGDEVLVLVCIPSAQRLRFDQEAGTRVPVYASAMGKVLLAFGGQGEQLLEELPRLAKLTGSTITSRTRLRAALDEVRRRGWALNDEEREAGVRTVAAPVLGADGVAVAAIAVQGPTVRMTDARLDEVAASATAAAAEVAVHLGAPR